MKIRTLSFHRNGLILFPLFFACLSLSTTKANSQIQIPAPGIINTVSEFPLYGQNAVAVDGAGNEYVSDVPDGLIYKVTASTGAVTLVAGGGGAGTGTCTGSGGSPAQVTLGAVNGLAVDANGNVYMSDATCGVIWEVVASTGNIAIIAGRVGVSSFHGDGGLAVNAELDSPFGLALDSSNNIYFLDGLTRVREITASNGVINTVAGNGASGYAGDGGMATSAEFNEAQSVAVDAAGDIYIADTNNNRIRKVTASTGLISTFAGSGTPGYQNCAFSGDSGLATNARLCQPIGIAVDRAGNLYFGDAGNNVVRGVIQSTGIITTLAGNGTAGDSGDGGPATSAELDAPFGIALDVTGNIYIEDYLNNAIRVVGQVLPISVLDPLYQVTSIIYAVPGNKSSTGYTSTKTNGSTTTLGGSFTNAASATFTEGFMPFGVGGGFTESFGVTNQWNNSSAFTETFTDATSAANQSISSNPNTVNHGQDEILVWLNPEISFALSGSTPTSYGVGTQLTTNGQPQPPDILEVTASTMEDDGSGQTTVDPGYLNPQTIPSGTNGTQVTLPGLAAICKNLNVQEYLNFACTKADQCGCAPSDFTVILAQDPLLNYNGTGTPYPGTVSPLEADASGAASCENPSTTTDCRYVPVPQAKGSTQTAFQTLQGPQCSTCNNFPNTFTQTDATSTTQTLGGQKSQSVGAGFKVGSPVFSLAVTDTVTWVESQSTGTATGSGNSQTVTFNSDTVGCVENINIYEDTVYHTFVFQEPTPNSTCP